MRKLAGLLALHAASLVPLAQAQMRALPSTFESQRIQANGTMLHVRVGGSGPAVLLIHGYGETGDMWEPLAAKLVIDHTVIVPDLRGMGLSSHPPGGYDKKTQGRDMASLLDALNVGKVDVVGHDIGNMVAYA